MKLKIIKDNIEVFLTGKYESGRIDLNDLGNPAMKRLCHAVAFGDGAELPILSQEEEKRLKEFWKPYYPKISDQYFRYYKKFSGEFHEDYIPEDLMFLYIDRYLSDRRASKEEDHKCKYYRIFQGLSMPRGILLRQEGLWQDLSGNRYSSREAFALLQKEEEFVVKEASGSECGMGVSFYQGSRISASDLESLENKACDLVIQEPIKQHAFLSSLHKESVNTLRIYSLFIDGQVIICQSVLRVGNGESRVDNLHHGGCLIGLSPEGQITGRAMDANLAPVDLDSRYGSHLEGHYIEGFADAIALVKAAHERVSQFRWISWDIAINEEARAVLVEGNYSLGMVREPQILQGPLFGEYTKTVLKEVFLHG